MDKLEYLHRVEEFLGRDIEPNSREEEAVYWSYGMGDDYQSAADLIMTREDHRRIYGPSIADFHKQRAEREQA